MADVEKLTQVLKRTQPASVKVIDANDEERIIGIPASHRKRWASVVGNIINRPWVRAVFLDAKDREIGYYDNDAAASDLETISDDRSVAGTLREERMLRMMLDAQKVALSYRDQETKDLLRETREMMKDLRQSTTEQMHANAQAMRDLASLYQAQVQVAADVAAMQVAAEHGGDMEQWLKVLEHAPDAMAKFAPLLQVLLQRRQLPAAKKTPTNGTPSNGVKQ